MLGNHSLSLTLAVLVATTALGTYAHAAGDLPVPTAVALEGDLVPAIGVLTTTTGVAISSTGQWIVEVDTDNPDTDADGAILGNSGVLFEEGQGLALPGNSALDSFGAISGAFNEAGNLVWNLFLDFTAGGTNDDSGIYFNDQLLMQEGQVVSWPGLSAGTTLEGFFSVHHNDAQAALVMVSVDDPAIASSVDRVLARLSLSGTGQLLGVTVLMKEGDTPPGQTETVADMKTSVHNFDLNDSGDALFIVDLNGDTAVDHVVYLNDTILAQEGSASPIAGRNWDLLSLAEVDLTDSGSWVVSGSLDGDTASDDVIVVDGVVVAQEGAALPALPGFNITSLGTTGASGPVFLGDNGNLLWSARWNGPVGQDKGLFLNDRLIAQIGVTSVGGSLLSEILAVTEGYVLSEDGQQVLFRGRLANGLDGAFLIDVGPWVSLGKGKAGTGGVTPCLIGEGTLASGDPVSLALSGAPANGSAHLVIGFSELCAPLKGGVLVPNPDQVIFGLPLDANGELFLSGPTPPGVPSDVDVFFQYWVADGSASFGFSASNGVKGTTP